MEGDVSGGRPRNVSRFSTLPNQVTGPLVNCLAMANSSSGPMPMRFVGHASAAAPFARATASFLGRPAPKSARAASQQMREIAKHQHIIHRRHVEEGTNMCIR